MTKARAKIQLPREQRALRARGRHRQAEYCTLYPGDVIWMGTDGSPRNMKPGDVCEIEIAEIGTLRNPVVAET